MAITIAIPFHSHPQYLEHALQSVLAQTSPDWICLVCDDSVGELGRDVTSRFADSRVHYVVNPQPEGMVGNWNFCLSRTETPWVTLLHADDELMPHYVRTMTESGKVFTDAAALYCPATVIDESGELKFSFPDWIKKWIEPRSPTPVVLSGEVGTARLLRGNFIMCPTLCYRIAGLEGLRFLRNTRWCRT